MMSHDGGIEAHVGPVVSLGCGTYFSDNLLLPFLLAFGDLYDRPIKLGVHFVHPVGEAFKLICQRSLRASVRPRGRLGLDFVHCL